MSNVIMNKKVSDFTVDSTDEKFKLSQYRGQYIILFFYPRDNTPGCTQESIDFSKAIKKIEKLGAKVFGISRDSISSHNRFIEKQ